jgi:hypothetical protein
MIRTNAHLTYLNYIPEKKIHFMGSYYAEGKPDFGKALFPIISGYNRGYWRFQNISSNDSHQTSKVSSARLQDKADITHQVYLLYVISPYEELWSPGVACGLILFNCSVTRFNISKSYAM